MAVNNKLTPQRQLDTSYHTNLREQVQQTKRQSAVPMPNNVLGQVNTSYQANTGMQYGGHDANWWNEQHSSQNDDNARAMVAKAADYYGYKMPNSVNGVAPTSYAANMPTAQGVAVQAQSEQETTPPTPPAANNGGAMGYEEWLKQQADGYKDSYDKQNAFIDEQKQMALKRAEDERQRSLVDARSSYEQNKASYGANAEAIASMGLAGSGYSEYFDSQAYAAQRADTQAANAQAEQSKQNAEQYASDAKWQAELTYQQNIDNNNAALAEYNEKKAEEKKAIFTDLLTNAGSGAYDAEQLKQLAANYGLDETQTQQILDSYYNANADEIKQGIANSPDSASIEANIDNADRYYADGKITQEAYQGINNDYLAKAIKGVATGDDYKTMKESIDKYKNDGKISQAQYDALIAKLKADTQKSFVSTVSSGLNAHSSTVTLNTPDGKVTVTYGVNSKSLKQSSGNAVFNSDIYKNAGSGQVLIVNGKPYVKLKNGDLGWVNDYAGKGAYEKLKNTYTGTIYDIS